MKLSVDIAKGGKLEFTLPQDLQEELDELPNELKEEFIAKARILLHSFGAALAGALYVPSLTLYIFKNMLAIMEALTAINITTLDLGKVTKKRIFEDG